MKLSAIVAAAFLVSSGMTASSYAQDKKESAKKGGGGQMTFFVTSEGSGKGADLGGLKGADEHCNALAKAAGSSSPTGTPISAPPSPRARPASTRAIASARARGATPRRSEEHTSELQSRFGISYA